MDDLRLMRLRADTGSTYDARGRKLLTHEPLEEGRRPAPRLFSGRTAAGDVVRVGAAVPDPLAARPGAILARELAREPAGRTCAAARSRPVTGGRPVDAAASGAYAVATAPGGR
jgi:hypothetical protein